MKKPTFFLIFVAYTTVIFVVALLLIVFLYRIFPNKTLLIFIITPAFGIVFGALCFLPFRSLTEKKE